MRVVGIDPGKSGACGLFQPTGDRGLAGVALDAIDIPILNDEVDPRGLARWLDKAKPDHVFIERVWAMPSFPDPKTGERRQMGAATSFEFGDTFGMIRATVVVCGWPHSYVSSGKWKKFYGLKGPKKEPSRQRALELMPAAEDLLARKKDSGRAEALLIARYGVAVLRSIVAAEHAPVEPRKPRRVDEDIPE